MNWLSSMTWYQQAGTAFFLGFCPAMAVALAVKGIKDERKILRMAAIPRFPGADSRESREGILVRPSRHPVTPTIVFARDYRKFAEFCYACRVNANSSSVVFASANENSPFSRGAFTSSLYSTDTLWKHVAFVEIDPESYYSTRGDNAWHDLERMRRNNQFTRAFYYPDIRRVKPNVTDEGRPWI